METADLSHHISRRFNEDLERVRNRVLAMGGFVEQQLQKAISALVETRAGEMQLLRWPQGAVASMGLRPLLADAA